MWRIGADGIGAVTVPFRLQHENARPCVDLIGGTEAMRRAPLHRREGVRQAQGMGGKAGWVRHDACSTGARGTTPPGRPSGAGGTRRTVRHVGHGKIITH